MHGRWRWWGSAILPVGVYPSGVGSGGSGRRRPGCHASLCKRSSNAFRYGEPDQSCAASLLRSFSAISSGQAEALLTYIPRHVVVVGNLPNQEWTTALLALDTQHLTLSVYKDLTGRTAHEMEGRLIAKTESLGFARYSEVDRCLRLPENCGIPVGQVQLIDQFGNPTVWTSRASDGVLWISKRRGPALLRHGAYVQLVRTRDGQIVLRPATV